MTVDIYGGAAALVSIRDAQRSRKTPTPLPRKGDRVFYRHRPHGDATDALVIRDWMISYDWYDDPNVVAVPGEQSLLLPDPWPLILLHTAHGPVLTREARVLGAAGWLPLSYAGEL